MTHGSETGQDFVQNLGDAVRKNPISAALIGMGVLWLFTGNRPFERAGEFVRDSGWDRVPDAAGDAFDAARSTLRAGTESVNNAASSASGAVKDGVVDLVHGASGYGRQYADATSDYGAEIFQTVRSNLADVFNAQPLALGAIGIAIGAGIAAALPSTELEVEYLGETSDAVKTSAAQFAGEQTDRVTSVAGKVVEAVREEAATQGLTLESAKAVVGEVSTKVGRVVDAAGQRVTEQTSPEIRR